jgi:hypothetical protein
MMLGIETRMLFECEENEYGDDDDAQVEEDDEGRPEVKEV